MEDPISSKGKKDTTGEHFNCGINSAKRPIVLVSFTMSAIPMANELLSADVPLPIYIDILADNEPERAFAEVLQVTHGKYTSRVVTIAALANAVDEAARWLDQQFQKDAEGAKVLAFMAPAQDLRYWIFLLGAAKTNRLAFFPSPRNDMEAQCALFREYGCNILLVPKRSPILEQMRPAAQRMKLEIREVPGLHYFLSAPQKPYIWKITEAVDFRKEPLVGLHTSGSTGTPKPVIIRHGNATAMERWKRIPELGYGSIHFTHWTGKTILLGLPLFHLAALNILMAAIQNNIFVVFPPASSQPLNAELVCDIIEHANIQILVTSPSILADMVSNAALAKTFSQVQCVAYGGGPLPKAAGDVIERQCHILNFIGMSECGILPTELVRQSDWQYIKFSPVLGIQMRPYADNLYELVFVRDERLEDYQVPFFTFPDLHEYSTKDLFTPHPMKPDYWMWQGRTDDIVVYSNGEKFNPTSMEDIIGGSPYVRTALVCGDGRPQSALLIEPNMPTGEHLQASEVVERAWPIIQQANTYSASHARIMKYMILVTDPGRPLPRAGKGTVQRKAAVKAYERELDALYATADVSSLTQEIAQKRRSDSVQESIASGEQLLTKQILHILQTTSGLDINADENFFFAGLDSLGVTALVRSLRKLLAVHGERHEIDARTIYEHPSATRLVNYINGGEETEADPEEVMEEMYGRFTSDLPITAREPLPHDPDKKVVMLTGSTGTFGTYLLDRLLRDETVAHIICLNRTEDAEERQLEKLEAKGLTTDLKDKTITFAMTDFSKQYFGLDTKVYRALLDGVTHVLHNAWHVNFNLPLEHFETPYISGVSQLIDFSARSAHGAMIIFISSIGAVAAYDPSELTDRVVPETIINDWSAAQKDSGYGQSKLVAERILAAAAREALVPSAIIRLGQLAGPASGDGLWPKQEWLPSLVMSSKFLGCLPATLGSFDAVDWVPVDIAANIVGDFLHDASQKLFERPDQVLVYHAVNPRKTTWDTLLPTMQPYLGVWNIVPSQRWVELLAESEDKASEENPAARLLTFYRSLVESEMQVPLDTTNSERASRTLAEMQPITGELFGKWLRKWVVRWKVATRPLSTISEKARSWDAMTFRSASVRSSATR